MNNYKVIISGRNIYKEIELSADANGLRFGTGKECDERIHRSLLQYPIELTFSFFEGKWSVRCSDKYYISDDEVVKLAFRELSHGDRLSVKYFDSELEAFCLEFVHDFEITSKDYDRVIDLGGVDRITIGAQPHYNLTLYSEYAGGESIELIRQGASFRLNIISTVYGVTHNGTAAANGELLEDGDFFSVCDFSFYIRKNRLRTQVRSDLRINGLGNGDIKHIENYPKFNRNTRIKNVINEEKIEILDPPAKPQKPKENLLTRLLPSLGMLVAAGVMAAMGSPTMIIFSGISGAMAIVTAIISMKQRNKEYEQSSTERIEKYNAYIDNKKTEVENCRNIERAELEEKFISLEQDVKRLYSFSSDLFDRTPEDDDFLNVRLGTGYTKSRRELSYKKQERLEIEDDLQLIPEQMSEYYKYLANAPVVCNLKEVNAIGVIGAENNRFEIFKNILVDITARHYYGDVKTVIVVRPNNREKVYDLRMLPHLYSSIIDSRMLVSNEESKTFIFEYLYKELSYRENSKKHDEHIVVFLYDEFGFKNHPLSQFVDKAKDLGVTFVFFAEKKADLAQGCAFIIDVADGASATLIDTSDKMQSVQFAFPHIELSDVVRIVKLLAPVYTEDISLEGSLTKNYSMFEMLNILAVDDIDLGSRWAGTQADKSMAAPIGISKTGMVILDLHDKADGPHGLVAGTTGSGKSEILQTYILAMATLYHPYEVGFVIIDFKGGGMANQFRELPHLLGAITNIDGKAINRSLKSIKAELQKRQRLFAEADVNHIDKYIRKYKTGEVSVPLPHLIIIVDEFAELKAEQPDFMKELISAARIGRSLGVHLILATQKPSGQVNEQIWSNSRFKLCLKVQDQSDSNEVLKSPLAAEIKEPGRAYLQVGNNERFELFQSAYSGAPERANISNEKEFSIDEITASGRRKTVFKRKHSKSGDSKTQLEAIVEYVNEHCEEKGIKKLPDICLPELEERIPYPEDVKKESVSTDIIAEIGIYDDPDNQYQGVYSVNLTRENLMIIGSAQTGKTNILQTIIRSLSTKYTPKEVNIYAIDFASMILRNFESLNHVGGVVTSSEDEKLKNLFKMLFEQIEKRKEKLLSAGVSSFAAYREAGHTDLSQIVLLIDNITALKEMYFQEDDDLISLCREGTGAGISVVIANAQTAGIGYKYLSNFANRIALFCNDSGEYSSLFDHCSERLYEIQGRGLVEIDRNHQECQVFLAFEGEKESDRVSSIREYIEKCNSENGAVAADIIPVIPEIIDTGFITSSYSSYMQENGKLVVGIDYASVMPFVLDIKSLGTIAVSGREGAGRHNFITYMVRGNEKVHPGRSKVYVVDNIKRRLSHLSDDENVVAYSLLQDQAFESLKEIESELEKRYQLIAAGDTGALEQEPVIILVLNSYDIVEAISNDTQMMTIYKNITGKYKNLGVCVIIGDYENNNVPYASPEIIKKARDARHFMFFDDIENMKILDMPLAVLRAYKKPIEPGDGYYIKDNAVVKVKTALVR